MSESCIAAANPFAQLIAPEELARMVQTSEVLRKLRCRTVIRADKPRTAGELAAFDAEIDAADLKKARPGLKR